MPKKPFPPTLKEKNRYMVIKVHSEQDFTREKLIQALWDSAFRYLGALNIAKSSFWLMDYDEDQQKGILRTNHKKQQEVRTTLTLINRIKSERAFISIEKVSGTLNKARKEL